MEKIIHIKNMVCSRCIKVVKEELTNLGLKVNDVTLGKAVIITDKPEIPVIEIEKVLLDNGFELIEDKHVRQIEKIKLLIIQKIHHSNDDLGKINFSKYIADNMGMNYSQLSTLFSSAEGITIEKFIIHQKIEKVKELLVYDEFTLSEISYRLGYSSVQHLSNQFKQITGLTPSIFKRMNSPKRIPIDKV